MALEGVAKTRVELSISALGARETCFRCQAMISRNPVSKIF